MYPYRSPAVDLVWLKVLPLPVDDPWLRPYCEENRNMNKGDFNHCTMLSHNLWVCLLLFFLVWLIDLLLINNLVDIAKIDDEDRNAMFPKHINNGMLMGVNEC